MRREPVDPLYMLAFDHRQVLRSLFGDQHEARFPEAKAAVVDVLDRLVGPELPADHLALLMDEEYGGAAVRRAIDRGLFVAMPIEASRTPVFELQYPDDYAARFASFGPSCVKALVFHNPADAEERQQVQISRLLEVGAWAQAAGLTFLLEVLVNPTEEQLSRTGGTEEFRAELLPELLVETIGAYQTAGIEPDIWKVEGLESVDACRAVGDAATAGGRDDVRCTVLGSGASVERVVRWLQYAGEVPSFSGFAIGRSVWHQPLGELLEGRATHEEAVEQMAGTFRELIAAFGRTGGGASPRP